MVSTRRSATKARRTAAAARTTTTKTTSKATRNESLSHQKKKKKKTCKMNSSDSSASLKNNEGAKLFTLDELVRAKLVVRPSKRNKSPYVADIWLESEQREALCHVPNLDMGGKCIPGVTLLVKPARTAKGDLVGPDAVSPKYGTPKCEFIAQLLHVDESTISPQLYPPTWVGAHPTLGERIAEQLFRDSCLECWSSPVVALQKQVRNPCGSTNMRTDFLLTHQDGTKRLVEVKTVVDTDYSPSAPPPSTSGVKCLFYSNNHKEEEEPYQRTALFPWGQTKQKGPHGEKVVSTRAIHHVQELTRIVANKGETVNSNDDDDGDCHNYLCTILFVVIRGDAASFRPNAEACPSFCRALQQAREAGVQVLARRVVWGTTSNNNNNEDEDEDAGTCYDGGKLDIEWPDDDDELSS